MAVWMVRAGKDGDRESLALEQNVVTIGWESLPDLASAETSESVRRLCELHYPDAPRGRISNYTGQVWGFRGGIEVGDLVVLPLKTRSAIALGRVTGNYLYRPDFPFDAKHTRKVEWIRIDIPRSAFAQDLLYSMGAFMTCCRIERNDAEERIRRIAESGTDPHLGTEIPVSDLTNTTIDDVQDIDFDLELYARDQIRSYIDEHYKGHEFTRLVDAVLKAQGYRTLVSPPGPDGGVDILAGQGPLGFDGQRLAVQVKSGKSPESVNTLRELQGVMKSFHAQQGLLVSWGGFKETVYKEARPLFFEIRLWHADDFLDALLTSYDNLSPEIQAELPLKRVWSLVHEE